MRNVECRMIGDKIDGMVDRGKSSGPGGNVRTGEAGKGEGAKPQAAGGRATQRTQLQRPMLGVRLKASKTLLFSRHKAIGSSGWSRRMVPINAR